MVLTHAKRKLWSRREYHQVTDAGVFDGTSRVELIEGEIVQMPPQNSIHFTGIGLANEQLSRVFRGGYYVRVQGPLALGPRSEPEPDLAVVKGGARDYLNDHPGPEQTVLVVEIAHTSLAYDRDEKLSLYARAAIPEYWIVNLADMVLEVHRKPEGSAYADVRVLKPGQSCAPLAVPDTTVAVADLLP